MDTTDIRKGLKLMFNDQPHVVLDFQFVKPGKGQSFNRTKVKNLLTGKVIERTFKSNESLEKADIEERQQQFLYPEGDKYVFMDTKTYEQLYLDADNLGDARFFLMDGMMVDVLFWNEKPIGVTPPVFVEMKVVATDPGFKGDTSTNTLKPAKMETGATVQVPLFVNEGDTLKVDTRTGEYVERVKR